MIIITGLPGQLGNSLILYASFLAFAIENKTKLINPSFYRYKSYFDSTDHLSFVNKLSFSCLFYFTRMLIKSGFKQAKELDWHQRINLDQQDELGNYKNTLLVQGWNYRGNETLQKHKLAITTFFEPKKMYRERLDAFFSENFKDPTEIIIGVHIRQGDYQAFENGKYYYTLSQYADLISKVIDLFKNAPVRFLVCSNEKYQPSDFGSLQNKIIFALGHELMDMYSLSRCSYIIGPPSTYSMWASFYGNVPLNMVHSMGENISLSDFKIQTHF